MLSSRLVRLIEQHWDTLGTRIIARIRDDPRLPNESRVPEGDLRDRARDILEHLGDWLTTQGYDELAQHFEGIGAARQQTGIPLHEVVLTYLILEQRMIEFVRAQGIGSTAVEIYAEEELEHSVNRFFGSIIYHVVRGYEPAMGPATGKARHGAVSSGVAPRRSGGGGLRRKVSGERRKKLTHDSARPLLRGAGCSGFGARTPPGR